MKPARTKQINGFTHHLYIKESFDEKIMLERSKQYHQWLEKRRSIRHFSDRNIPKSLISELIMAASTAPSGAHKQPWTFCAIRNPDIKRAIRKAAEKEEYESYQGRMSDRWLHDLIPLGTDWEKPFLEIAPWLLVIFKKSYDLNESGEKINNYYVNESVNIAAGFLLTAIHHAGLVALTHTPSPMSFLTKILQRPPNEKPVLLIPIGYPADPVYVPDLKRKTLEAVSAFYE